MKWLEDNIKQYYDFLKSNTHLRKSMESGWIVINTPYVGTFNDTIDIYAKKEPTGQIVLSDDGLTLKNLELVGVDLSSRSKKRKEWLNMILLNYGITLQNGELVVHCSNADFAQKKHNLLSAIFAVSEMECLADNSVRSIFKEDVMQFLNEQDVIYTREFIAKGSTGLDFTFDFQIAGRETELLIQSFGDLTMGNVPRFLFTLEDVREARGKIAKKGLKAIAIVSNKGEGKEDLLGALTQKGADYIIWDDRHNQTSKLIAS